MFFLRTTLIMIFVFCILCGFSTIPYGERKALAADRNVANKSLLEKEIKTIHLLLKRICNAELKPSTMQSPPDWAVLPHVIHALSIREPQYAISAFNKMPQEVTEAFYCKRTTASLLAQSLEEKYAKEFLLACQRTNNQKIIDLH